MMPCRRAEGWISHPITVVRKSGGVRDESAACHNRVGQPQYPIICPLLAHGSVNVTTVARYCDDVLDELVGGAIGGEIGERLGERVRARVFARKVRSIVERDAGSTRATLFRPDARLVRRWRGAIVRSGDQLRWRPFLRRWRTVDLNAAAVVGWTTTKSFWRGEHLQVNLSRVEPPFLLEVTPHRAQVVRSLFGSETSDG